MTRRTRAPPSGSRGPWALPPPVTSGSRRSGVWRLTSSGDSRSPLETRRGTPSSRDARAPTEETRGAVRAHPGARSLRVAASPGGDLAGLSRGDRLLRARRAAGGDGADACAATCPRHTRVELEAGEVRGVRVSARVGAARSPGAAAAGPAEPPCAAGFQVHPCLSRVSAFTISGSFQPVPFPAGRRGRRVGCPLKIQARFPTASSPESWDLEGWRVSASLDHVLARIPRAPPGTLAPGRPVWKRSPPLTPRDEGTNPRTSPRPAPG